jgi:hypothetical protein
VKCWLQAFAFKFNLNHYVEAHERSQRLSMEAIQLEERCLRLRSQELKLKHEVRLYKLASVVTHSLKAPGFNP